MLFTSIAFICFFLPTVLVLHTLLRGKARNYMLLVASLLFYAWGGPNHLFIMIASMFCNWLAGLAIDAGKYKKLWLGLGVALNLSLLGYFKYFNMVINLLRARLHFSLDGIAAVALPIGISFYTFQAMSYLIDLYRGKFPVQKNLFKLMLYISLFPQLIAGPIVQYGDVVDEIDARSVTLADMAYGIKRFIYGLSKKMIFSNGFAAVADGIFAFQAAQITTGAAWLGAVAYTLQIYYDFSGYSDMAIGLGRMLGFHFLENFNYPYISASITEFWRRWHISLSSWFRNYLYIPLGGNRKGTVRTLVNLGIVFAVTGLWHGAELQFVAWGLYHGVFLIAERLLGVKNLEPHGLAKVCARVYTLLVVVFGWVLFRAPGISYARAYIERMVLPQFAGIACTATRFLDGRTVLLLAVGVVLCGPLQSCSKKLRQALFSEEATGGVQITLLILLFVYDVVLLVSNTYNPFIYFRF